MGTDIDRGSFTAWSAQINGCIGIASTACGAHINNSLIHTLNDFGYRGRIAVTAYTAADEPGELKQGTDAKLVLVPFSYAANKAACRLLQQLTPEVSQ